MRLFIFAAYILSTSAFANVNVNVCTEELKIKTLQSYVNTELMADYTVDEAKKNLLTDSLVLGDLAINTEDDFLVASGYIGECAGGSVWGRIGIQTSNKVLPSGLCEIVDTLYGGMCED